MNTLIQQGKILYWGTSEWSAQEILQAHIEATRHNLIPPLMEQPQYNLFEREKMEKEYLHLFRYQGLGTTIWSPLASGLLPTGKYNNPNQPLDTRLSIEGLDWLKDRTLQQDRLNKTGELLNLAESLGTTLALLSLAWCLKNPNVSTVILGASKTHQLTENLKAFYVVPKLTTEVLDKIEAISLKNKPEQPQY
jgi:aryl-alcohol dehydrogenase-like predicted oxidoreductase